MISARPYAGASDLPALIEFAQRTAGGRATAYYHPGDFVCVRLWVDDGGVVACAIFEPPMVLQFEVDAAVPEREALHAEILRWAESRRARVDPRQPVPRGYEMLGADTLATFVLDSDEDRIGLLRRDGFTPHERGNHRLAQDLRAEIPAPVLPAGAVARHVRDVELEERVDLHRDAWSVWGASSFDLAAYRRLRAAPLYDRELDIVLEVEGRLVSYCVCWTDSVNGIGLFEPVGTRPSCAGRGYGKAVMAEGLRRLRARGMGRAIVSTATVNPGALALYRSSGFSLVDEEHGYVKGLDLQPYASA
jgi:ribosomal protein S18 acetylase RimI-like enzyme